MACLVTFWQVTSPLQGAAYYWDADENGANSTVGGTSSWGTSTAQWDVDDDPTNGNNVVWPNSAESIARFAGSPGVVTLAGPILAGGLYFDTSGYTVTGGILTLAASAGESGPKIHVAALGSNATLGAVLAGNVSLAKTGTGTLFLTSAANTYTGDTVINDGSVVITDEDQLGTSTTTISINGIANTGNPGFSGGQLVVNGVSSAGPVIMTRDISVIGRGPGAANGVGGLMSVGNNTFNGDLVVGGPASEGRVMASHGFTTVNGNVLLGTGAANLFLGNGNFIINGKVSGFDAAGDRFVKSGNVFGTTLWLTNAANDYRSPTRIDSGTIRVSTSAALGVSTSTQAIDLNGGILEIQQDTPDFAGMDVRKRGNGGGIFVDHAFGSTVLNQTVTFGNLLLDANASFVLSGRNGYGATFSGAGGTINWSAGGTGAFTNNSNGVLKIDANINRLNDTSTSSRNFTFTGTGDIILTGDLLQTGSSAVNLIKDGSNVVTLLGMNSTATGTITINAGTLQIHGMGALPSGTLNIGNATTGSGALTYLGAGETSSKTINLNTTTASVYLNASGTGALVLNGLVNAVTGNKTLVLGGSSTAANEIASALPTAGGTLSLQKRDTGTWVLSGANQYSGSTTISGGTLQLNDTFSGGSRNVVMDASSVIFNVDTFTQAAGGTLEYRGDGANDSMETLGQLVATAGAGTVKVAAGSGGTASLIFSSLGTISAGSGINFVADATSAVTLTNAVDTNGILNAHLYYNGADFASGSSVTAATYTVEDTGASLVDGSTQPYLVTTTDITNQVTATINAGIKFGDTRNFTLASGAVLTINNGANTSGGILVAGDSTVTLSGGAGVTSGGSGDLVFRTDGINDVLKLNTAITNSTTGGWTKLGAGTLELGAANANTTAGQVHINEGTVRLTGAGRLGADSMDVRLRQGATLDLKGISLGSAASGTASLDELNGAGTITNSGAAASIRVGNGSGSSYFTGSLLGPISLTKSGTGTFRLQGAQSYSGVVTLSGGNFDITHLDDIGAASGLGTGDGTSDATNAASLIFNGGALRYIGQDGANIYQTTNTPSVSIDRLFTLAGNGTIASFGSTGQNGAQGRVANHAALVFNNTAAVAFSGSGSRTLTLRGDSLGDNQIDLQLIDNPNTGTLGITKADSGLWILGNAANSYTGVTTIAGGALRAQDGTTLPTASNLFLSGGNGVLQMSGSFTRGLGSGANQVRFTANGNNGFAASTAPLTVNLGSSGLVWGSANSPTAGTANFIAAGSLYLSSSTSWADVDFVNDFEVTQGIASTATVSLSNTSTTVTLTTGNTNGLTVGQAISGTNIPAGAYITSINSLTSISISVVPTATATGIAATISAGGVRQIVVDDNANTGLDFATASGVISGAGGIGKAGAGILILGDANTYSGKTMLRDGGLVVTSIGAAGATSSSLGTNLGGGDLEIGNPGTSTTARLMYVGSGETTTRVINLVGTTGTRSIDSSGSGALILTALFNSTAGSVNTAGGAKTLELRGSNMDGNMVTSVLANNGGNLTVSKFDSGLWILNPTAANTFTGVLTAGGGTLGLTANGVGSASRLDISNGAIFAHGGDLELSTIVNWANNTTAVFAGTNDITLNGIFQVASGNNDGTFSNNLEGGAVLTINNDFTNLKANDRTFFIRGYGSTVWNGSIQNASANSTGWDIRIHSDASFTTTGGANNFTGTKTLGQGTFILDKINPLGPSGTFNFHGGVLTVGLTIDDLAGPNAIANTVILGGDPATVNGDKSIEFSGTITNSGGDRQLVNDLDNGAELTLSGPINLSQNTTNRTFTVRGTGDTIISGKISNGGGSTASAFRMRGTGTVTLTALNDYKGATSVENGVLKLSGDGALDPSSTITVSGDSALMLDNTDTNLADRVSDTTDINLDHGTLHYVGHSAGSAESFGRLDVNANGLAKIEVSGGDSTLTFLSLNLPNSGSALDVSGIAGLGTENLVKFGTAPSGSLVSNGIIARIVVGSDFAEYDASAGLRAFSGYSASNNLAGAAATDTMLLTANVSITGSKTVNAVKLDSATGVSIGASVPGATLTLTSGGLIATGGGTHQLNTAFLNTGSNGGFFQIESGTTLKANGVITGGAITLLDGGSLELNARQFYTSTTNLHGGTLKLNGGLNTIMATKQSLFLNKGATLDLNGNVQFVGSLLTSGSQPGHGGQVISSTGTGTLVTTGGDASWMGSFVGSVNVGRVGSGTYNIGSAQTHTGWTFIAGGTTTLRDEGTLESTSGIDINIATLNLSNNDNLQMQNNDRINDAAAIALRGATLNFNGRVHADATETLGDVTSVLGANTIASNWGGTGTAGAFASATLTLASLTREDGSTVNFTGSNLGALGNNARILINEPMTALGDGYLGAWAIANSTDYAAYNAVNGVGIAGSGGFAGYDVDFGSGKVTNLGGIATAALSTTLGAGTTTTGMLRFQGAFNNDLAFTGSTDVLNLEWGGILRSNNNFVNTTIGTAEKRGVITAGGTETSGTRELVIYNAAAGAPSYGGGATSSGSLVVTMSSTFGLLPGMTFTGSNIPAGTTIASVDSGTQVTLSQGASASGSNITFAAGYGSTTTAGSNVVTVSMTTGLAPGMTISGAGIPTGSVILSVDGPNQVTISQNATATGSDVPLSVITTNVTINSVIADNGFGNEVHLVKSGAGTLVLTANNTYTGGTTVNQGTLNLLGSGVIIPDGVLTLTSGNVNTTAAGQIGSGTQVVINGAGILTLIGDNTLRSITINNIGGSSAPTVLNNGILTLTDTTAIKVTSNNAGVLPVINGIIDLGSTDKIFDIGAMQINGVVYDDTFNAGLHITGTIVGSANLTKSGAGLLRLSGANAFGNLNVTGGGIILAASSTGTVPNSGLISGPLGTGTVTMAAGTSLLLDESSRTVANAITFSGNPIFGKTDGSVDTMTLNGPLTFSNLGTTGTVATVNSPYLNVVLGGRITGIETVTSIGSGTGANTFNKAGPGNITGMNLTGISSTAAITLTDLTNSSFALLHDGDGTNRFETINLGVVTWEPANNVLTLTIGRAGTGEYFPTPAYKTIELASLNSSALVNGITLTNNNGYGLVLSDDIALSASNNFNVVNANTSLQPVGLTLDGILSGNGITKTGNGVLKLGNAGNTFTGLIDIANGTVEASVDEAFGNASNIIRIGSGSLTEGLRISGTFDTARTIQLNGALSGIDVTRGNTFTLNTAFTFVTDTHALAKNDLGTLVLTQAQTGWDGAMTINQGVLRITNADALGSTLGTTTFGNVGASLELVGGLDIGETLIFNSGDDVTSNGVNGGGAVRAVSGVNTLSGDIQLVSTAQGTNDRSRAATFTADSGAELHITGVVTGSVGDGANRDSWIGLGGAGEGFLDTAMALTGSPGTNRFFSINKFGSGKWSITAANAHPGTRVIIKEGTLALSGAGTLGTPTTGQEATPTIYLNPTSVLLLDNTDTDVDNRLSGRALNVSGADVTILGHADGTSETVGAFTLREGLSIITLDADTAGGLTFATGSLTRSAGATLLVRGDNLGDAAGAEVATFMGHSSYAFTGQLGNTDQTNKAIIAWALGDKSVTGLGAGFLTADSSGGATNTGNNGLRLLRESEQVTDLSTANANVNLTTARTLSTSMTINSLLLGNGGSIMLDYTALTLDSGGLLAFAGNGGINGHSGASYITSTANRELILHTVGDLTLNIPIAATTGTLTKSGAGTLTLTSGNTNHSTVFVNDGTLKMGGGDHTILPGRSLQLNNGGAFDLNGTVQHFNLLESRLTAALAQADLFPADSGGVVKNSSATQATLALATGNVTFAGSIEGNVAVARSQAAGSFSDWNLYSEQTYTGPSLFNGGRTQLLVEGRIANSSSIEVSNATFVLSGSNGITDTQNITDRIGDTIPITLRGGAFHINTSAAYYTTETVGEVALGGGQNVIAMTEGGTRVNQWDLTFASLNREPGSHATLRFYGIDADPNDNSRLFITDAPDLDDDIIGGWAVFEREFASYHSGHGVGGLTTQGYAGYSPNQINNGTERDNIRIVLPAAGQTVDLTGNRTINSLNLSGSTSATGSSTLDLGGHTLVLDSGGLIASVGTNDSSITIQNGNLTAGELNVGGDLYLHTAGYINGNTDVVNRDVNIDANLVDNGTGAVTVVINAGDGRGTGLAGALGAEATTLSGNNTYSGGTYINAGRVILNTTGANGSTITATGSGNVIIAGGASTLGNDVREFTTTVLYGQANQIAETATVTLMGGAVLNLSNFNTTLANLAFNNTGGTTPQVITGSGTLTLTGNLTASGQNLGSASQIDGRLSFNSTTATLTVNPVEWNNKNLNPLLHNLAINAVIEGTNLVKTGEGLLRLSGTNVFTGTFELQEGGLSLNNNNALSGGELIIGDGSYLTSTSDARVIANAYTVNGDFALRDVFNLTMTGAGTLTAGNHNIQVEATTKILTLSGMLSGATGGITKTGNGILVLGNGNNSFDAVTVADGILRLGAAGALPNGAAVTMLAGGMLDITSGGTDLTFGSLAGDSASAGGMITSTATSGTVTLTVGTDNSSTAYGGVIRHDVGSILNFVKVGTGTLTLGGANRYAGSTTIANGRVIARAVSGGSALGTSKKLVMGGGTTSGILQLGDSTGAVNETFTSIESQGTGTQNKIVGGASANSTVTFDLSPPAATFAGNFGGAGTNEDNLNVVKTGTGDLVVNGSGVSTYKGTTTVSGGKLFMDTTGAFSAITAGLTLADGTEFALRGTSSTANQVYGFSGVGNVITVGSTTGATLGFGINGAFNTQLHLGAGQTMTVNGSLTAAIYVNGGAVDDHQYVLIDGTGAGSLHLGSGTFNLNPVIFNGGSFTYTLSLESGINGGGADQLVLTANQVDAASDVWWKGDLTGLGAGVWSAATTTGLGSPSNWDTDKTSGEDAVVPPDSGSIVHFSADGAQNLNTTLGANLTIQELIFHTGNAATSIGSSNGTNTLTLGNATDASGLTIETGAGDVSISAIVNVAKSQSWNIHDTVRVLRLSGGLTGTGVALTVNDTVTNAGTLIFSGEAGTMTGTLNMNAGTLVFEDTGSLNGGLNVTLGTASTFAILKLGGTTAATRVVIGGLSNGAAAGSKVIGGNSGMSTLVIGPGSGTSTFNGSLGGAGTNENQFNLEKDGAGTQVLNGAMTYAGATVVREGTLQIGAAGSFSSGIALSILADAGAMAIFDINGKSITTTGTLTLGGGLGGQAKLIDSNTTKGSVTLGGDITLDATGDPGGAVISANLSGNGGNRTITVNDAGGTSPDLTLSGTFTTTTDHNLTIAGAGDIAINGNISLNTSTAGNNGANNDLNLNTTGTVTVNAKIEVDDDILINSGVIDAMVGESLDALDDVIIDGAGTPGSAVVNIHSTTEVHKGNEIFIRNGGRVNVLASGGIGTGTNSIIIGDSSSGNANSAGVLNLANASISPVNFQLGAVGNIGNIIGTGTITTTGTKTLQNGEIEAGITLAGNGAITKNSTGTVTFSGERAAASTGGTNVQEGVLILDYSTNNNSKIGGVLTLGANVLTQARLVLNGSSSADTVQSVGSTTISTGDTVLQINHGSGRNASLNLGAITRSTAGGTVSFEFASHDAKATSTSPAGTLGWATLPTAGGGQRLAAISGTGEIVQATYTTQNDPSMWVADQNVIVDGALTGGPLDCTAVTSLTFTGATAATVNIASGSHLNISSGAIMVDASVGAFNTAITGGQLHGSAAGALGEIIVYQNNTQGSLTISSDIINSAGITKTGAGTLEITGSNTYLVSSQVSINEGKLTVGGGNAIGDRTTVWMRSGTTFDLNGSTETIGHLSFGAAPGTISLGNGGSLTVNQTASTTWSGVFTGDSNSTLIINGGGFNLNVNGSTTSGFTGMVSVTNGLLQLSGSAGRLNGVTSFTINKGGNLLLDNLDDGSPNDRISNSAEFTLHSADGTFSGETIPRGLAIRTDNNGNEDETIGALTFGSGANYVTLEATGGTDTSSNSTASIIASSFTRENSATVNVRARNLGGTTLRRSQFKVDDASDAAMIAGNIGGNGVVGGTAKNVAITPWAIGENNAVNVAIGNSNMGNTFVTYVDNRGFVALNFNEYSTYAAAAADHNTREVLTTTNLTGLAGKTINSLAIHNNNTAASNVSVQGAGAGQALTNTSGAFLFTLNASATASSAHSITVGGFDDGIKVGTSNEYVMWVMNPSGTTTTPTLTAVIESSLNSTDASLTKSGRGTLELKAANSYSGGTTVNEGVLTIHDNENLGTGGVTLAGGTLRLASDFADDLGDLTTATLEILNGGGTLEVLASSVTATDFVISGAGALTKVGTGTLQLAGNLDNLHTGDLHVRRGVLELNKAAGVDAIASANLYIGFSTTENETATVRLLADDQIDNATNVIVRSAGTGAIGSLDLNGHAETIGSLHVSSLTSSGAVVRTGATGVLTVLGDITLMNDRTSNDTGTNPRNVLITGTGSANTGTLDLGGATRTVTVETTATTTFTTGRPDATIETVIQNGGITKEGSRVLYLGGANTYTGGTTIRNGGIELLGSLAAGDVLVSEIGGTLANAAVLTGSGNGTTTGVIGGPVTLGEINGDTICGVGILKPGLTSSATVNTNGTLTITAAGRALTVNDGSQIQLGITSATFTSSGLVSAMNGGTATNALDYLTNVATVTEVDQWNSAPSNPANHDYINLTGADSEISVGDRASGAYGDGSIVVTGVSMTGVATGQVFNVMDWESLFGILGDFDVGSATYYDATGNVTAGDLDLPSLGSGFAWDVSAFKQYGVIVVVPEPGRMLLLFLGALALLFRRRRPRAA